MVGATAAGDHHIRGTSSDAAGKGQLQTAPQRSLTTMRGVGAATSCGWWVLSGWSGCFGLCFCGVDAKLSYLGLRGTNGNQNAVTKFFVAASEFVT